MKRELYIEDNQNKPQTTFGLDLNNNAFIDVVFKAIITAAIVVAFLLSITNFTATKATAITTTFAADSSWTKGGWK